MVKYDIFTSFSWNKLLLQKYPFILDIQQLLDVMDY
jgi:hypothetical protein